MNKCPYCGFETKEGDVFCMNCGAALDEDFATSVEPKKKKNHTALWIILAAVVVLIAGAAIYLLNRPELILARAAANTYSELSKDEGLSFIGETIDHGSIEVNMELGDLLSGFSIPLLSEIDARAGIKLYNNAADSEHMIKITGSLGGSSALGADLWISPEHIIIKSPTFIGRDAYGIALDERDSREEAEALLREFLGIDISLYDQYSAAIETYLSDKEDINEKLLKKLYTQAFKTGTVKSEKTNYDFGKGDEKTRIITISFDREQLIQLVDDLYAYALAEEDLQEFADEIDKTWIKDFGDSLSKDFLTTIAFYIDEDNRLARIGTATDGVKIDTSLITDPLNQLAGTGDNNNKGTEGATSVVTAIQFYDGDLYAAACVNDISAGFSYVVGRNNRTDYSSRLDYMLSIGECSTILGDDSAISDDIDTGDGVLSITDDSITLAGECDFSWEKDSGKWELYADGGFKATGELYYDAETRTAEGLISKIRSADFTFEPNANIIVIADDEMPEAPEFKTISSDSDVEAFVALVMENVQSLISEFMADYMGDMMGGLGGIIGGTAGSAAGAVPEEAAEPETEPETAADASSATDATGAAGASGASGTTAAAGASGAAGATANTSDDTLVDPETLPLASSSNSDVTSSGLNDKTQTKMDALTGSSSSGSSSSGSSGSASGSSGSASGSTSADSADSETVKTPDKPVSGTYFYDDGKEFSMDLKTGKYTEHVTVEATLNADGTYELVYSNGFFSYNDAGTYDRDANNNMTFASGTGINATGKYYDDYIEVTIPGYITGKLEKVD